MMSLIGTLIVVIIVSVFAGFNLNNKCDINLVYRTFNDIPVFLAIMISFVAGVIVSLPYVFVHRSAMKEKIKAKEEEKLKKEQEHNSKNANVKVDAKVDAGAEKKFSLFGKKKKDDEKPADEITPLQSEKPVDVSPEVAAKLEEIDSQSPRMQ